MPEALLNPDAPPLAAIPDEGGTVDGLRLLSGDLVVGLGCGDAHVQVRVRDAPRVPDGGGLSVMHDYALPPLTAAAFARRATEHRPVPCTGQGSSDARRHARDWTYSSSVMSVRGRNCIP